MLFDYSSRRRITCLGKPVCLERRGREWKNTQTTSISENFGDFRELSSSTAVKVVDAKLWFSSERRKLIDRMTSEIAEIRTLWRSVAGIIIATGTTPWFPRHLSLCPQFMPRLSTARRRKNFLEREIYMNYFTSDELCGKVCDPSMLTQHLLAGSSLALLDSPRYGPWHHTWHPTPGRGIGKIMTWKLWIQFQGNFTRINPEPRRRQEG